jgi:hypothetical protein
MPRPTSGAIPRRRSPVLFGEEDTMIDRNHDRRAADIDRPPSAVVGTMLALVIWLIVPWWVILGPSPGGAMTFAVCVAFSVIAFGIVAISATRAVRARRRPGRGDESLGATRLKTFTGPLPLRHAALQLLTIPAAVALGFTAIALVDAAERIAS